MHVRQAFELCVLMAAEVVAEGFCFVGTSTQLGVYVSYFVCEFCWQHLCCRWQHICRGRVDAGHRKIFHAIVFLFFCVRSATRQTRTVVLDLTPRVETSQVLQIPRELCRRLAPPCALKGVPMFSVRDTLKVVRAFAIYAKQIQAYNQSWHSGLSSAALWFDCTFGADKQISR